MHSSHALTCRRFRAQHAEWVDLDLKLEQALAMERHSAECPACRTHDTSVRRALLVMRNMPDMRPSAHFMASLEERLAGEREAHRASVSRHRPPTGRAMIVVAASLIAMAWLSERRPPAGLPMAEQAALALPREVPSVEMPRADVRSAPLRGTAAVRVVSVQRASEPVWAPAPLGVTSGGLAPTMVAVSYRAGAR